MRLNAVSQIKVVVPNMALGVIDMAMQLHGGAGLSDDFRSARRGDGAYSSGRRSGWFTAVLSPG